MPETAYNMSFTAAALRFQESVACAAIFLSVGEWQSVKQLARRENLIQSRTDSSSKRVSSEICQRLEELHPDELKLLAEGTVQEQQQILWLAICRRHRFLHEFAVAVVREKYLQLNLDLYPEDYDAFFNAKAQWHDELDRLAETTRMKLRQVTFKMLREADILTKTNSINPTMMTPRVARTVGSHSPDDLRIFPLFDRDIRELLQ